MKRPWIIAVLVLVAGVLVIAFLNAKPEPIQNTPINIPKLRDIVPAGSNTVRGVQVLDDSYIPTLVKPTSLIQTTTERLMKQSCEFGTQNCKLLALYDFVRLNFEFSERTPESPYIRTPGEILLLARGDDGVNREVTLTRRWRTEPHGLVGASDMEFDAIRVGVDGDRPDTGFVGRSDDAQRDLAPVRDEEFPDGSRCGHGPKG